MGKDLKGKELGRGLTQRKNKKYSARFVTKSGARKEYIADTLKEAKQWLADAKYEDAHSILVLSSNMTVNAWFAEWSKTKASTVRENTLRIYTERYKTNIQPILGRMEIAEVKPAHCQKVLSVMAEEGYAGSTIQQTLHTMVTMFWSAFENDLIRKTPITKSGVKMPKEVAHEIDFFTLEEQKAFLAVAKDYAYYAQFRLILETGLRTGEVIGLCWRYVNLDSRTIQIEQTLEYRYERQEWKWGVPKTRHGKRTIHLTPAAYDILMEIRSAPSKVTQDTPEEFKDLVFLSRKGLPIKNSTYDAALVKRCSKAGVKVLSMHDLRHTFATRFVESSSNYKFLSEMLGHSSIKITMDLYVHVTDETRISEIEKFAAYLNENGDKNGDDVAEE